MKHFKLILCYLTGISLLVISVNPQIQKVHARQQNLQEKPDIILGVDGMSCPFCAFGIEKKLKKLDEIKSLNVKLEKGFVDIYLKENQTLAESAIREAVKKAGFSVRSIEYKNKAANRANSL